MTATYDCIAKTSLTSSQATIEFTSIPQTYTDLVLFVVAESSSQGDIWIRVNSDASSSYAYTTLSAYDNAILGAKDSNVDRGYLTDYYGTPSANTAHVLICNFQNYANTTTFKPMISRSNSGAPTVAAGVDLNVGLWRSTSAITSLLLRFAQSQTFSSGTNATLYGIKCE